MNDALLELREINTFYGPVQVHFDLSLSVGAGQIVCLLGGNASGKSTTMKIILGLLKPRSGEVLLDGEPITGLPTPQIVRRGVGSVPESRRLFPAMTVRENLMMGAYTREDRAAVREDFDRVLELFPRLRERLGQQAGTLSGGEQQMCAIARGLMSEPRLLLVDEPFIGLSPHMRAEVTEAIRRINAEGVAILLIEQNVPVALAMSHRAYILREGRVVLTGPSAELAAGDKVQKAFLGRLNPAEAPAGNAA